MENIDFTKCTRQRQHLAIECWLESPRARCVQKRSDATNPESTGKTKGYSAAYSSLHRLQMYFHQSTTTSSHCGNPHLFDSLINGWLSVFLFVGPPIGQLSSACTRPSSTVLPLICLRRSETQSRCTHPASSTKTIHRRIRSVWNQLNVPYVTSVSSTTPS